MGFRFQTDPRFALKYSYLKVRTFVNLGYGYLPRVIALPLQLINNLFIVIRQTKKLTIVSAALILIAAAFVYSSVRHRVDYISEVKPILNKKCIVCHGGVRRQADLSFLFRSEALQKTKSGKYAIVPGFPEKSEMIRRITSKDAEERMPYHHEPLTKKEIDILTDWVKQGARWGDHWAYVPVQKVEVPQPQRRFFGLLAGNKWDWPQTDIDHFIYQKIEKEKLTPSAEADKPSLLRRVCFDLIGLPASPSLAGKFLSNNGKKAYEDLVDSLLASRHFGEKWTAMWLDLARYADTKGYERDAGRSIWHYRDWLIRAFNQDMPYNQFLIEQIAGDLLPGASDDQIIATAFHRNTMTNDEGGTDNEEFRTAAVIDRVNTTWQALMGTTFSCVQCHSHPYDPFTHDEYYKFMAFFNDTRDEDTWADYPLLRHFTGQDSLNLIKLKGWLQQNGFAARSKEILQFLKTWQPAINSIQTDAFQNCELSDTKWLVMRNPSTARLKQVDLNDKTQLLFRFNGFLPGGVWTIHLDSRDGAVLKAISIPKTKGWQFMEVDLPSLQGVHDLWFTYKNPNLKSPNNGGLQFDWFYFTNPFPGKGQDGFAAMKKTYWELLTKDMPATPVMLDNPASLHRKTFVFERGNWLVKGKEVTAGVPHVLNPFPKNVPNNRLGLAMWLTDKRNPLTARTMVNRLWEQLFGTGIVETLEDLGTQGAEPTDRELLDFLSYRIMYDDNWSIKKLLKEIVLSATYRQDSRLTKENLEKDPYNKFYARGPRVRLSAEQIRDQALALSGLLSEKMFGSSVMPWQPEGVWMSPWNGDYWKKAEGEDQYRRAVYTFWKRTSAYPSMTAFDAVGREVCTSRRIRTNTPLQALATLNDSAYLEAARQLAYKMEKEANGNVAVKISKAYENAFYKPISNLKLRALENLYYTALQKFKKDPDRACEMIGVQDEHNNPETAALVVVMNAFLNLDEIVTKN